MEETKKITASDFIGIFFAGMMIGVLVVGRKK
jgi:hypothetical protein